MLNDERDSTSQSHDPVAGSMRPDGSKARRRADAPGRAADHGSGDGPAGAGPEGNGEAGKHRSYRGETGGAHTDREGEKAKEEKEKGKKQRSFWKELPVLLVIGLLLAFGIKTWVVEPYYVPSGSMENTLLIGDRVFVNKLAYLTRDIERGEVIVFDGRESWDAAEGAESSSGFLTAIADFAGMSPDRKDYTKRVIGLPGDTVECCDDQGRIMVNGEPVDEPYLFPGSLQSHEEFGPVKVGEGRLWVMGDHRAISLDSRGHEDFSGDGTIPIGSVAGPAFLIHWPLDRISTLSTPQDAFANVPAP
ncbi:signal peptidase I [Nocardiopsis mwathae]|uniref:Signal peptidase I n=1 Tax=Nocardiopsis mwathae TaxID=1472723 RepID=A0A7W9YFI3_9ACTN|nr:signal peptidase I [Nocardiopsis mwathae]MBB6170536.1 signal peptidase I [Nocardiopsis mwathae]